jgi:hypothetical protein
MTEEVIVAADVVEAVVETEEDVVDAVAGINF